MLRHTNSETFRSQPRTSPDSPLHPPPHIVHSPPQMASPRSAASGSGIRPPLPRSFPGSPTGHSSSAISREPTVLSKPMLQPQIWYSCAMVFAEDEVDFCFEVDVTDEARFLGVCDGTMTNFQFRIDLTTGQCMVHNNLIPNGAWRSQFPIEFNSENTTTLGIARMKNSIVFFKNGEKICTLPITKQWAGSWRPVIRTHDDALKPSWRFKNFRYNYDEIAGQRQPGSWLLYEQELPEDRKMAGLVLLEAVHLVDVESEDLDCLVAITRLLGKFSSNMEGDDKNLRAVVLLLRFLAKCMLSYNNCNLDDSIESNKSSLSFLPELREALLKLSANPLPAVQEAICLVLQHGLDVLFPTVKAQLQMYTQLTARLSCVHSSVTAIVSRIVEPHSFSVLANDADADVVSIITDLVELHCSTKGIHDTEHLIMHIIVDLHGAALRNNNNNNGPSSSSNLILSGILLPLLDRVNEDPQLVRIFESLLLLAFSVATDLQFEFKQALPILNKLVRLLEILDDESNVGIGKCVVQLRQIAVTFASFCISLKMGSLLQNLPANSRPLRVSKKDLPRKDEILDEAFDLLNQQMPNIVEDDQENQVSDFMSKMSDVSDADLEELKLPQYNSMFGAVKAVYFLILRHLKLWHHNAPLVTPGEPLKRAVKEMALETARKLLNEKQKVQASDGDPKIFLKNVEEKALKLLSCGEWCRVDEMQEIPGSPQVFRPNLGIDRIASGTDRYAFVKELLDIVCDVNVSFDEIATATNCWQSAALWATFAFGLQNKLLEFAAHDDVCVARLASALISQKHLVVRVIHGAAMCCPGEPHNALLESIARSVELLAAKIESPLVCVQQAISDLATTRSLSDLGLEEDDKVLNRATSNPAASSSGPITKSSSAKNIIMTFDISENNSVKSPANEVSNKSGGNGSDPLSALLRSTAIAVFTGMAIANSNLATRQESHPVLSALQRISWQDWLSWEPGTGCYNVGNVLSDSHSITNSFDVIEITHPKKVETSSNYRDANMIMASTHDHWESSGPAASSSNPHWILITLPEDRVLHSLKIHTSVFGSYAPKRVRIRVGVSSEQLRLLKEVVLRDINGEQELVSPEDATDFQEPVMVFRIEIIENHDRGMNTKIGGIRVFGSPYTSGLESVATARKLKQTMTSLLQLSLQDSNDSFLSPSSSPILGPVQNQNQNPSMNSNKPKLQLPSMKTSLDALTKMLSDFMKVEQESKLKTQSKKNNFGKRKFDDSQSLLTPNSTEEWYSAPPAVIASVDETMACRQVNNFYKKNEKLKIIYKKNVTIKKSIGFWNCQFFEIGIFESKFGNLEIKILSQNSALLKNKRRRTAWGTPSAATWSA